MENMKFPHLKKILSESFVYLCNSCYKKHAFSLLFLPFQDQGFLEDIAFISAVVYSFIGGSVSTFDLSIFFLLIISVECFVKGFVCSLQSPLTNHLLTFASHLEMLSQALTFSVSN